MDPRSLFAPMMLALLAPALANGQATEGGASRVGPQGTMSRLETLESYFDWQAYTDAGWRAMGKGFYDTAEHEFQGAIRIAGRISTNDRLVLAWSYADLAWALFYQDRHAEAEPLAKWALDVREARLGPRSPLVAQSLYGLAAIQTSRGKLAEAEAALRRALAIHDAAEHPDHLEAARVLASLGQILAPQRRYAEAEALFAREIPLREASLGASHPDTAEAVANLASALFKQGKEDEALPLLRRAVAGFEQARGRKHASLAPPLLALADIQGHRGEAVEAEAGYRRALALLDAAEPAGNRSTIDALRRFTAWLDREGRAADAVPLRARSDAIQRRLADKPAVAPASPPGQPPGGP